MPRIAPNNTAQQYAVLPWRRAERLEILLITSRQSKRWLIPKGWPMPRRSAGETAAQEAYEEAGIIGQRTAQAIGQYGYSKHVRSQGMRRFRVEVFGLEVTQVLQSWPESQVRKRQWFSPAEAAVRVRAPELAMLIRTFAEQGQGQHPPRAKNAQAFRELPRMLSHLFGLGRIS
jgi:8-oxo-dGTP pyrophosphatase MutT (NUDIX family)